MEMFLCPEGGRIANSHRLSNLRVPLKVKQKMGMSIILVDKENVVLFRLLIMNSSQGEPLPIPTSHV